MFPLEYILAYRDKSTLVDFLIIYLVTHTPC